MKMRGLVASLVIAGFLSGVPALAHADQLYHGWGDYDQHHEWHSSDWWLDNHPNWVKAHHPQWAKNGDWDDQHHWHDRHWWKKHDPNWAREHHHDWF
jgi:hypothetical protein